MMTEKFEPMWCTSKRSQRLVVVGTGLINKRKVIIGRREVGKVKFEVCVYYLDVGSKRCLLSLHRRGRSCTGLEKNGTGGYRRNVEVVT